MAIMERRCMQVIPGKEAEALELEAAFTALEDQLGGFPPKRTYWPIAGPLPNNTLVWERDWESVAAAEATYAREGEAPGLDELVRRIPKIYASGQVGEIYFRV